MRAPAVKLAICAIIKNESRYIYEWLSYHYAIGVRRFVLYSNNSTDDTLSIIASWPRTDLVTVIHWPYIPGQASAYGHMIEAHRDAAEWCAFIDGDEFLCPQTDMAIADVLNQVDASRGGLYAHWLMFGSSGHLLYDPALVTERFQRRAYNDFGPNRIGKTIAKLSMAEVAYNAHIVKCAGGVTNDSGDEIDPDAGGSHPRSSHRLLALNHYFTKSLEEWRFRRSYGRADKGVDEEGHRRAEQEFHQHDANDVEDGRAAIIMQQARKLFY